jgi:hypothetical protein
MVKGVIELLATVSGRQDANIDLENLKALGVFYGTFLVTSAELPLITLPVANIPFAKRFAIAVETYGWHPDFFAMAFRGEEWAMLVTHASESGRTALHWAAEQYGWSESYADLVVELIRQGSDVHACWNEPPWSETMYKVSPFTAFLQRTTIGGGWDAASLADAVSRWGRALVDAGQSLKKYAATETDFLRGNRDSYGLLDGRRFVLLGLVVLGEDILAIRIQKICDLFVWKASPTHVPGAWPASPLPPDPNIWMLELPDTIIWFPEDKDEREGFHWVYAHTVNIKVRSYLVERPERSDFVEFGTSWRSDEHHRNIEDDHDLHSILITNALRSKQRPQTYTRRRSASAPTVFRKPRVGRCRSGFPAPWNGIIHQCALDMRWRISDSSGLRNCMQTRCREWTGSCMDGWFSSWEVRLLGDEGHVQVARRFAQRFYPQYLEMVEMTSARATERAQLAMGPARPPSRSW